MDNDTLMLLAKFTIQARKTIGAIDSNLLSKDAVYRSEIFKRIDAQADEELLLLSLMLRSKLDTEVKTESSPQNDPEPPKNNKYMYGSRG